MSQSARRAGEQAASVGQEPPATEPTAGLDFGSNQENQAAPTPIVTFRDGGGYAYEALPDGTYLITAAPRPSVVGLVVSEGTAFDAIHALYLSTVPPNQRIVVGVEPASADPSPQAEPLVEAGGDGLISSLLDDLADGVREVAEFVGDTWSAVTGWWAGDETQPAAETVAPSDPEVEVDELRELMAQDELSADAVARARALIALAPAEQQAALYGDLQSKVVFRNQRNNESASEDPSGGTCNVTALAMCLEYLGVANPYPEMQFEDALDQVRIENDYGDLTWASTWTNLARHFGHEVVELGGGVFDRQWWEGTMQAEYLSRGYGVLVSIHGHIVRLQGTSADGVIVDDPYGASLLQGGTQRGWDGFNGKDVDGTDAANVGEDLVWPWDAVEAFSFKYFRAYR